MSGMKRVSWLMMAVAVLLWSASAYADEKKRHPELDKFVTQDGGTVEFLGNAYGLDGWVVITKDGHPKYAYTTPEGGLVVGMLVGPDGQIVTRDQLIAYKERKEGSQKAVDLTKVAEVGGTVSKAERAYADIEKANWVRLGDEKAPYLYIFMNVNCEHCQLYWQDLQSYVRTGALQVRFVPFGSQPANREGGAALLSADDPKAAWEKYIGGDKTVLAADKIKPGALDKLDANTKLFAKWEMKGVPFSMYRKPLDGVITGLVGRPENKMIVIGDLMQKK